MTSRAVTAVHAAFVERAPELRPPDLAFAADLVVKMALAMARTGARDYAREIASGKLAAELSDMILRYLLRSS